MTKKSDTKTLSEPESRALLRQYEIPCVSDSLVEGPDAAVAAAREFGYPVVLKLSGAGLAHKSERGLVRLGIGDEESVSHGSKRQRAGMVKRPGGYVDFIGAL